MGIAVDVSARTENNGNVSLKERVAEYEHAMNEKSEGELEISGAVSANEGEREKLAEMGAQTEESEHGEELKEESAFGAELVRLGAVDVSARTENKFAEISMGAQTDELDVDVFVMARLRRRVKAKSDDVDALSAECKKLRAMMKRLLKKNEAQHRLVKFYQNSLRSRQNRLSEAESLIERYREKFAGMDAHIETVQNDNFAKFLLMSEQQQHIDAHTMLAQPQPNEEQNHSAVADAIEINWPTKDEMSNDTRRQRARVENEQISFVDGAESVEPDLPIGANQNSNFAQPQPIEANETCNADLNVPAPTTNREMFRQMFDEKSNDAFAEKSPKRRSRYPFT